MRIRCDEILERPRIDLETRKRESRQGEREKFAQIAEGNLYHSHIMYCENGMYERAHIVYSVMDNITSVNSITPASILRATRLNGNAGDVDSRVYISHTLLRNRYVYKLYT